MTTFQSHRANLLGLSSSLLLNRVECKIHFGPVDGVIFNLQQKILRSRSGMFIAKSAKEVPSIRLRAESNSDHWISKLASPSSYVCVAKKQSKSNLRAFTCALPFS